jgi:hypothetical protein|nr:MAG TPA: Protein of unknown function (DUF3199) [Caudoviricetes sp.]
MKENIIQKIVDLNSIKSSEDRALVEFFLDVSIEQINRYLNRGYTAEQLLEKHGSAVILLVNNKYQNRKNGADKGIKSKTQGQRSVTYGDNVNEITSEIKALLPLPLIGLL